MRRKKDNDNNSSDYSSIYQELSKAKMTKRKWIIIFTPSTIFLLFNIAAAIYGPFVGRGYTINEVGVAIGAFLE